MSRLCKGLGAGLLALQFFVVCTLIRAADAPQTGTGGIQIVNYAQLGEIVKKYRGKVLLVDFWNYT